MSQMPPPPPPAGYPPPPPGGYPPPGGFPPPPGTFSPPSGFHPPGSYQPPGYPPQGMGMQGYPSRTSAAAIASLVFGILLCIPFITGILAFFFGVIGIFTTRKPGIKGRGLAITCLCLGILGLLFWSGAGGFTAWWLNNTVSQRAVVNRVVDELAANNIQAVSADCTSKITTDEIKAAIDHLQKHGAIQVHYFLAPPGRNTPNTSSGQCIITFTNGQNVQFPVTLVDENGVWKVDSFVLPP